MKETRILVVDDDDHIINTLHAVLRKDGFKSFAARDGVDALNKIDRENPHLVFMDITMPGMNGLETLKRLKSKKCSPPVVMMTGYSSMNTAVAAMKLGAFEYLIKPLSVSKIRKTIEKVLSAYHIPALDVNSDTGGLEDGDTMIGNSPAMLNIFKMIGSAATTPAETPVYLYGESGTGKELVARAIHCNGKFPDDPFMAINCTALPETLLESELFGHEKGTFSGATERKKGKFEIAANGTIFLDEIGDLSYELQLKLLRVLQEREFTRLGGHEIVKVNARFIAASNQDLERKVKEGTFREDLYYRLDVVNIKLPPLRERKCDIPLLAAFFLGRFSRQCSKNIRGFTQETMAILKGYHYPGNVRELENIIKRAVMHAKGELILPCALSGLQNRITCTENLPIKNANFSESRDYILGLFEKKFVSQQLEKYHGNITAAAHACQMSRQNFHRLVVKHHIRTDYLDE
ncbi:sigma-54-dependent Fis family transcriptional regulator [candidate division KSB1 bacterium]|nr:sigma-54-dependent Fis family transcriptional regulator [candidate division KSB1 bacterium]